MRTREIQRRCAALLFYSVAARLHVLVPGGRALRRRLADVMCESVAPGANIAPGVVLSRNLTVGRAAGVGAGTVILGAGSVQLGDRLRMGPQCLFITNDHVIPTGDATFDTSGVTSRPIVVGADAFLGARTTVLPGVTIGSGAATGAGSVVTRDVPAGAVVVGNPARVVRQRAAPGEVSPTSWS